MTVLDTFDEETIKQKAARSRPSRRETATSPTFAEEATTLKRPTQGKIPPDPSANMALEWEKRITAWLDEKSHGHGEELMRVLLFLIVGGSASVVNLICIGIFDRLIGPNHNEVLPFVLISVLSTEISLLYNFTLNDRFTFRSLHGGQRPWLIRCLRFHGPASVGFFLTLAISTSLFHYAHFRSVIAQAIAIVIVMFVNFTMHRFWTFRPHTKPAPPSYLAVED